MKLDFIEELEPHYVRVKPNRFVIDGRGVESIQAFIEDVIPVRKLFLDKKLICQSQDGKTGKNGAHCALCRDRYKCRKRLRLMLVIENCGEKSTPAILEINPQSFDPLREAVRTINEDNLKNTLMEMSVGKTERGALLVLFKPLF
jgi:hypothetical protein